MENTKIILGIALGAAAGAIAGILLAPASGKETRKKIVDTSCDWGNNIKDRFTDLMGSKKFEDDPWAKNQ